MKRREVRCVQGGVLTVALLCLTAWQRLGLGFDSNFDKDAADLRSSSTWEVRGFSRHLTSVLNCTPRAIEQFPRGLFTQEQRVDGAVVVHILAALYMFIGFAFVCDDYFVPALEILCDVLNVQSDVAGATFMAAGSSAPELATAVIAIFVAKDDIGLGAVVGSAVYNVMFVVSFCALFAGMVVHLHWWPLFRDCAFYSLSVASLALVIYDGNVYWYESLGLVLSYILYIVIMYYNKSLESWIVPKFKCCSQKDHRKDNVESIVLYEKLSTNGNSGVMLNGSANRRMASDDTPPVSDDSESEEMREDKRFKMAHFDEEPESVFAVPDKWYKKMLWVFSVPVKLVLYVSVPDCRRKAWRKWYAVTFTMSLVWLSVFSYLMVWMITVIGYTWNIPDTVMSLTIVAFGVSLPDVIASLIVVREGHGDMAVSNAVGSNVFDILICLGIPWLIRTIISKGKPVEVYSGGLLYASLTLLLTVVFLLAATHVNKWRLTKKYGVVLMVVYVVFTVLTCLYELNIFGYVHPIECKSDY